MLLIFFCSSGGVIKVYLLPPPRTVGIRKIVGSSAVKGSSLIKFLRAGHYDQLISFLNCHQFFPIPATDL